MNIVISFDPSGNFYEGKGTTGYAISRDGYICEAGQIYSAEASNQMEYWTNVIKLIKDTKERLRHDDKLEIVCEDYRLYASASEAQINSNLETPQLIGAIKWFCYMAKIPITLQMAAEVKSRWSNEVMEAKGLIHKSGTKWRMGDIYLSNHSMDAVRHLMHYNTFKVRTRTPEYKSKRKRRDFHEY